VRAILLPKLTVWGAIATRRVVLQGLEDVLAGAQAVPCPGRINMAYWLLKTEPEEFSWDDAVKRGAKGEPW